MNRPYCVRKAVFFLSSSVIEICQYPKFILSIQNQRMSSKLSMHSSMRGDGYASLSITEFSALKLMQYLQLLSRFLTSTRGEANSETLGSMTLAANMASKCCFSSPSNPNGLRLIRWRMGNAIPVLIQWTNTVNSPMSRSCAAKTSAKTRSNSWSLAACSSDNLVAASSYIACRWAGNLPVCVSLASSDTDEQPSAPFWVSSPVVTWEHVPSSELPSELTESREGPTFTSTDVSSEPSCDSALKKCTSGSFSVDPTRQIEGSSASMCPSKSSPRT